MESGILPMIAKHLDTLLLNYSDRLQQSISFKKGFTLQYTGQRKRSDYKKKDWLWNIYISLELQEKINKKVKLESILVTFFISKIYLYLIQDQSCWYMYSTKKQDSLRMIFNMSYLQDDSINHIDEHNCSVP